MKRGHIQILAEFVGGLNDAINASSQLIHQLENPKFMAVRDMLNIIRDGYVDNMVKNR